MTTPKERRRAPGMTAEQRRETIVRAALPLVAEFGAGVTTAKIARAAGIGEATIFRVFADKNAVLEACVLAAMDPAQTLQELESIALDQPLAARLTEAVDALDAYLGRMGAVIGALNASGGVGGGGGEGIGGSGRGSVGGSNIGGKGAGSEGISGGDRSGHGGEAAGRGEGVGGGVSGGAARFQRPAPHSAEAREMSAGRNASQAATRRAVLELFEPERPHLRQKPEVAADTFLSLFFGRSRLPGAQTSTVTTADLVEIYLHGALATA
ncbi:TetR/AcrR family transcriptional regulator [Actinoplanes sp. TRM 88003]|uniref:TetR/AcrR family transcriptional regulator n=1 Tax=Paractinoplanes aksuensis TaxID=2939490 RepID=A0ABT1DF56_9ACTN|nr:TetR/AcrR family transcriptional regulator [Actinoplanes aksuensis]MCO8269450.1 TetR/AcrR family transcriptional regulator [Actinoplanes aksuensis]